MSELTIKDIRDNVRDTLFEYADKTSSLNLGQATDEIMQLIDSAITEARIDEIQNHFFTQFDSITNPNYSYIINQHQVTDRIKELKDNTSV